MRRRSLLKKGIYIGRLTTLWPEDYGHLLGMAPILVVAIDHRPLKI